MDWFHCHASNIWSTIPNPIPSIIQSAPLHSYPSPLYWYRFLLPYCSYYFIALDLTIPYSFIDPLLSFSTLCRHFLFSIHSLLFFFFFDSIRFHCCGDLYPELDSVCRRKFDNFTIGRTHSVHHSSISSRFFGFCFAYSFIILFSNSNTLILTVVGRCKLYMQAINFNSTTDYCNGGFGKKSERGCMSLAYWRICCMCWTACVWNVLKWNRCRTRSCPRSPSFVANDESVDFALADWPSTRVCIASHHSSTVGWHNKPVADGRADGEFQSTIDSFGPPLQQAITGLRIYIASIGTIPKCSFVGV